jgi:hypothetical protein
MDPYNLKEFRPGHNPDVQFPTLEEKEAGPTNPVDRIDQAFNAFFRDDIMGHLLNRLNRRRGRRVTKRAKPSPRDPSKPRPRGAPRKSAKKRSYAYFTKPVSMEEFRVLLSMLFAMCVAPQPTIDDYWAKYNPLRSNYFKNRMGKMRWLEIFRF